MSTGIIWDSRFLGHLTGPGHPESPARLKAIKEVLDSHSKLIPLDPRQATEEEILWIHSKEHIQSVASKKGGQGYFDLDTPYGPGSVDAAYLAAGSLLAGVDAIEEGKVKNIFAFPRPPGHHAESNQAMGFCFFNNVAIAAEYLLKKKNKQRVAILDFDVHHGNGTQHSFYARSDVFYLSLHRFPFYPGTGAENEIGVGKGKGYTLNLPYGALADDDDYEEGFDKKILPALEKYKPDFLLVSAGFDAHERDPLGGMRIKKKGFKMMAKKLEEVVKKYCAGKSAYILEGGYDMKGLQEGVEGVLEIIES